MLVQNVLIAGIYFGQRPGEKILSGAFEMVCIYQIVFQGRNCLEHPCRRKICGIKLAIFDGLFYAPCLVGLVINAKVGVYARIIGILVKNSDAQGMEGADMCSGRGAQGDCPLAHLVSGFVGEGYRADIAGRDARVDKSRDAIRYNTGFAAARAGKNKQWPFNVENSFSLRGS
jgi:hypothetical protein